MICHYGAELSWYIRNEPATATELLETMFKYYHESNSSDATLLIKNTKTLRLLEEYFDWAEASFDREKMTLEEGEKIGLCLTEDFFRGKITINELSHACGEVYGKLEKNSYLYSLLKECRNLSSEINKNPAKAAKTIEKLFEYFDVDVYTEPNEV